MNWLDIVIMVVIAISTLIGLRIGLIKAALSLAGIIVGVILAGRYYAGLSARLTFISQADVAKIAAFAIIMIGIMLIAGILALLLSWIISALMLGWANHLGGAVFGFALGTILCSALLALWAKFQGIEGPIAQSSLAALLLDRFPIILALLPNEFSAIRSFFQQ